MLISSQIIKNPSSVRLIRLWAERYTPDLASKQASLTASELTKAASPEGRALTASKLRETLIKIECQFASIQTGNLYEYIPNVVDLQEARRLAKFALHVYLTLLKLYQQLPLTTLTSEAPSLTWGIADIKQLSQALEPVLIEFQEQHVASKNWRALGFITTLLNFSNELLANQLSPAEQVFIHPYFKFVEEQVAIPWQRVCVAAATHRLDSPALFLVEQMLPMSDKISWTVYNQLVQRFPEHHSRRGKLDHPGVLHSCLRDLNMFQAYLWLCILQENLVPVEQELVVLCSMVMESVKVSWEMTAQWNELLIQEVINQVSSEQQALLRPYADGMSKAFYKNREKLGARMGL